MKPQDIYDQIVGPCAAFDGLDVGDIQFYNCEKFAGHDVAVLGSKGIVEVYEYGEENAEGIKPVVKTSRFAIRATLEPITEE